LPTSSTPRLSILLSTRNRSHIAHDCVRALLSSERVDFELIVRLNGSEDDTGILLASINDPRLHILPTSENIGTRTFFEIAKLATGDVVTWISDEDNLDVDAALEIVSQLEADPRIKVAFGAIVVGKSQQKVTLQSTDDYSNSKLQLMQFSGCGGIFIRRDSLTQTLKMKVDSETTAYHLWNYYPIGFLASRCVGSKLHAASRVVVTQSRYANTTNNWSREANSETLRHPHYYPQSEFDRLVSNTLNTLIDDSPLRQRLKLSAKLGLLYARRKRDYLEPAFVSLLMENYPQLQVDTYISHIQQKHLDKWLLRKMRAIGEVVVLLPVSILKAWPYWRLATTSSAVP